MSAGQFYPNGMQVNWGSNSQQPGITYNVYWMDPTATTMGCHGAITGAICLAQVNNVNYTEAFSQDFPNGTITFSSAGATLATCNISGTDSCTSTLAASGSTITATYSGDSSHLASSVTIQNPNQVTTTTTTTTSTSHSTSSSTSHTISSSTSATSTVTSTSSIFSSSSDTASNSRASSVNSTTTVTSSDSSAPPAPPPSFLAPLGNASLIWLAVGVVVLGAAILATTFVFLRRKT